MYVCVDGKLWEHVQAFQDLGSDQEILKEYFGFEKIPEAEADGTFFDKR